MKFTGCSWEAVPQVLVVDFLRWVFTCRVFPHVPRVRLGLPQRQLAQVWTALQYIAAEDAYLWREENRQREAAKQQARWKEKAARRRADIDRKNAASHRAALERAAAPRRTRVGRTSGPPGPSGTANSCVGRAWSRRWRT
ncbi:hypothetical protein [Streptomyces rectiverticillatus]|uniref:hypothetical protein n=1 Tax=Streptomyces rectiverticillatus TaxID=173860 RepID=UPI0015C3A8EF|nr:hypothetical protein [Streptomyces rectiverticillatus]